MLAAQLLFPEGDGAGFGVHSVNDGKGFQLDAQIADYLSADLEALFDHNADAFHGCSGSFRDSDQALQRAAVCQKVVNNQKVVIFAQELLGNNDLIFVFKTGDGSVSLANN